MRIPIATYRLQFSPAFSFTKARSIVPYLYLLGVTDLYASPIFKARQGSHHGYDVTDPRHLNPQLGTAPQFQSLVRELKRLDMGLLLDIVPNHMAASPENPWWMDVLENGQSSAYATYFDINWQLLTAGRAAKNRILLPVLSRPYHAALRRGEFTLGIDKDGLFVQYHGLRLPLDPRSYEAILGYRLETLTEEIRVRDPAFQTFSSLIEELKRLPDRAETSRHRVDERHRQVTAIKHSLWQLYQEHSSIRRFLDEAINILNDTYQDPATLVFLDCLLRRQAYRLTHWHKAATEINYRRFFNISDLIGLRVEDPRVLKATHDLIYHLVDQGKVTGLRVDHVDGLYDPLAYLTRLQARAGSRIAASSTGEKLYIVVEKILTKDEELPSKWPICGTTGYDFLNTVNAVSVDPEGVESLGTTYRRFCHCQSDFAGIIYTQKRRVLTHLFSAELRQLGRSLQYLAERDRQATGVRLRNLIDCIAEVTACCPVYRTYTRCFDVSPQDRSYIEHAVRDAKQRNPGLCKADLDYLHHVLLLCFPPCLAERQKHAWLHFVMCWQQVTGAVMAKGLEDTALYVYNHLISLNEVGGHFDVPADPVKAFHQRNHRTLTHHPYTLNATSTHDTKRSEDVRARLNVLSEIPAAWARCLWRWSRYNSSKKRTVRAKAVPDRNEETHLYQTMLGAWPLSCHELPGFRERLKSYAVKAAREAKTNTSWRHPNQAHERALTAFVDAIFEDHSADGFLWDFKRLQEKVAFYGMLNALGQVLLKVVSPGIPDFYQGTELWDFSMVDPDNRRPVDYCIRARMLRSLMPGSGELLPLVKDLLANWRDGRIKLFITNKALELRRASIDLFLHGDYIPLTACGSSKEHIVAFARHKDGLWVIVVVPRLLIRLVEVGIQPLGEQVWGRDHLVLPPDAPKQWMHLLTGETIRVSSGGALPLSSILRNVPFSLLSSSCPCAE